MSQDDFSPVEDSETPAEIAAEIVAMLSAAPPTDDAQIPMDVFNRAARDLPYGFAITITLEKDSGVVEMADFDGEEIECFLDDASFEEKIDYAVRVAKAQAQAQPQAVPGE